MLIILTRLDTGAAWIQVADTLGQAQKLFALLVELLTYYLLQKYVLVCAGHLSEVKIISLLLWLSTGVLGSRWDFSCNLMQMSDSQFVLYLSVPLMFSFFILLLRCLFQDLPEVGMHLGH